MTDTRSPRGDALKEADSVLEVAGEWRWKSGQMPVGAFPEDTDILVQRLARCVASLADALRGLPEGKEPASVPPSPVAPDAEAIDLMAQLKRCLAGAEAVAPEGGVTSADAVRSCNRHADCDASEALMRQQGRTILASFHCDDDDCEDCFGR